jgi:hypothetical protein
MGVDVEDFAVYIASQSRWKDERIARISQIYLVIEHCSEFLELLIIYLSI